MSNPSIICTCIASGIIDIGDFVSMDNTHNVKKTTIKNIIIGIAMTDAKKKGDSIKIMVSGAYNYVRSKKRYNSMQEAVEGELEEF